MQMEANIKNALVIFPVENFKSCHSFWEFF
jgi:hypothetical protein